MDLSFLLRAERLLDRRPHGGIDHGMLCAALAVHQAASATGRVAARETCPRPGRRKPHDSLIDLLAGGARWAEAKRAQRGAFNPAIAHRSASTPRKGASPPRLPSHFRVPSRLAPYNPDIEAALPVGPRTF